MFEILEKIISLPKSLYVSFMLFPFKDAIKLPVLCRYNVKIISLKGRAKNSSNVKSKVLSIGFGSVGIFDKRYQRTILQIDGCLNIKGKTVIGHGSRISVAKGGCLTFGRNFINTAMMTCVCNDEIVFGDNVLVSWDVLVMDTDWHEIINLTTKQVCPISKKIFIDDNVWICARVVVLKGCCIAKGCIVGANSVVGKSFDEPNSLIAGNPAVKKKNGVTRYENV